MKNIMLLLKNTIKHNRLVILAAVFGAVVMCFFLGAFGKMIESATISGITVGVSDMDQSILSENFKAYLTNELSFKLMENNDYNILSKALIDKDISVIIEIPEGFYKKAAAGLHPEIIVTATDDYENAAFTRAYLNSYLGSIDHLSFSAAKDEELFNRLLASLSLKDIPISQYSAQLTDIKTLSDKEGFISSFGFFLMIVFGLSTFLAYMMVDDRLSGVFSRIKITPVRPAQYIIGSGLFGLLICLVEAAIYCGYIGVKGINIGFPLHYLVFMIFLFSLFTVCFTVAMSLSVQSKNAVISIIIAFSTVGAVLGGAYFSLDLAPKGMQNMAKLLPQYWFMDSLRKLQADPTASILPNIAILILFTVLTFLIGAVMYSSQNSKNA